MCLRNHLPRGKPRCDSDAVVRIVTLFALLDMLIGWRAHAEEPAAVLVFNGDGNSPALLRAALLDAEGMIVRSEKMGWRQGRLSASDAARMQSDLTALRESAREKNLWIGNTPDGPTYTLLVRKGSRYSKFVVHGLLEWGGLAAFQDEIASMRGAIPEFLLHVVDTLLEVELTRERPYSPPGFSAIFLRGSSRARGCPWPREWSPPTTADALPQGPYDFETRYRKRFTAKHWPTAVSWWSACPDRFVQVGNGTLGVTFEVELPGANEWRSAVPYR